MGWVDARKGASVILLQIQFCSNIFSRPFLYLVIFTIWAFFSSPVKLLFVFLTLPSGKAGIWEFSKCLLNEQKVQKIFCKRYKKLNFECFERERLREWGRWNACHCAWMATCMILKCSTARWDTRSLLH